MTVSESVACPFCDGSTAELIALFGSQLLFSQFRCLACGSYFEGLRQERAAIASAAPVASSGGAGSDGHDAEH